MPDELSYHPGMAGETRADNPEITYHRGDGWEVACGRAQAYWCNLTPDRAGMSVTCIRGARQEILLRSFRSTDQPPFRVICRCV
jgi:hypothetical protein